MKKLLLKQIAGTNLKFRSNSTMGFTTGNNWIILSPINYQPGNSQVNLSFVSNQKPTEQAWGEFTTSFTMSDMDINIVSQTSVNTVIEECMILRSIEYLKSFNPGCDFEEDIFN